MEIIEFENRKMKQTIVESFKRKNSYLLISTVALPCQYPPFETMVFGCGKNGEIKNWDELDCKRYYTWKDALKGHEETIKEWGTPIKEEEV